MLWIIFSAASWRFRVVLHRRIAGFYKRLLFWNLWPLAWQIGLLLLFTLFDAIGFHALSSSLVKFAIWFVVVFPCVLGVSFLMVVGRWLWLWNGTDAR